MLEKIKYNLSCLVKDRRARISLASLIAAIAVALSALFTCSIHTINIFDGKKTYTVRSLSNNVAMVMDDVALTSENYKILETKTHNNVTSVKISYTYPVYITKGDTTTEIQFAGGTVKEALATAGFTADKFDFVEPSLETKITDTTYIDYTDIEYITKTEKEDIDYDTKTTYSKSLKSGEKKVTQKGEKGEKEVTYTQKLVNGVVAESEVTKTVTLKKPVTKKVSVGVKAESKKDGEYVSTLSPAKEIELDENGVPVKYKSKMTVRATAYTHTGNRCSTGVKPQPGYIAVNPKVIPYGTEMFIKTTDGKYIYGYAVAADTGGFIKNHPTGIDLFFDTRSECVNFGVRTAEIYILN